MSDAAAVTDSRDLQQQLDSTKQDLDKLTAESQIKDASHQAELDAKEKRCQDELAKLRAELKASAAREAKAAEEAEGFKRKSEELAKQRDQLALQEGRKSFQPTEGAE